MLALLDWMLETTGAVVGEDILALAHPRDRVLALIRPEIERIQRERERVELFFDFWVMGTRHPEAREKIRATLSRYREAFRPLMRDLLASGSYVEKGLTAEGMAAVAVRFIEGCALQIIMDPEAFDLERYLSTVEALTPHPGPP